MGEREGSRYMITEATIFLLKTSLVCSRGTWPAIAKTEGLGAIMVLRGAPGEFLRPW